MTIGTDEYTFVANGTTPLGEFDIELGSDLAGTQANIVAKINERDDVSASTFANDDCTITALVGGTAGNAIACTETFTAATNVFSSATLLLGTDCSADNAILAMVAASAEGTEPVAITDGAGSTLVVTATTKGTVYESIETETTCALGTFNVAHLDGGVDGTIGYKGDLMMDATYLYICYADNGTSGTNWRRIALGTAY
jgi:hypothetical protein